jgi:HEAT repeat protein
MNESPQTSKKILDNPIVGSLTVPIAIVLIGSLIIFGISKMLSTEKSYKDLVNELHSKTFGNKWVAAYELSKQLNSSQIPVAEYPWLIANLSEAYKESIDPRTRGFIIAALGSLKNTAATPAILIALKDSNAEVKFHALVALSNMPKGIALDWSLVTEFILSDDELLKQAAILTLATHHVKEAQPLIRSVLQSPVPLLKYSAANALINFQDEAAIPTIKEILSLTYPAKTERVLPPALDLQQIADLKLSVLLTLQKNNWNKLNDTILELAQKDQNAAIALKAKEVLNTLKN